jgi:hypothetical protein
MNTKHEMTITEQGVAYDPSYGQHQVRIVNELIKGLVFGILEIATNEIIWMEMPFQGQVVSQLSIGNLLRLKAAAQQLAEVDTEAATDESYTTTWAMDAAKVTQLSID